MTLDAPVRQVDPTPGHPTTAAESATYPGLTGLRGVAVIAVVLFHTGQGRTHWLGGGWAGVDVFFVVSGFLVTGLLLTGSRRPGAAYRQFLVRRAGRLLPAMALLIVVLGLVVVIHPAWSSADLVRPPGVRFRADPSSLFRAARLGSTGILNLYAARGDAGSPLLGHLWSLDVEWQFYLTWPIAVLCLPRATLRRATVALMLVGFLAPALEVHGRSDWRPTYFNTVPYLLPLCCGALLAQLRLDRPRPGTVRSARLLAATALAAELLVFGDSDLKYRFGVALVTGPAAVLVWAATRQDVPCRLLGRRWLRWVGERSYGIYLWHLPILILAAGGDLVTRTAAVALAVVVAALSFRFVETPVRRWVRELQRPHPTTRRA